MSEYNKAKLAELLMKAKGKRSINELGRRAGISGAYLSLLIRGKKDNPPEAKSLRRIADVAHNEVTYVELMDAAGLVPTDMQSQMDKLNTLKGLRDEYNKAVDTVAESRSDYAIAEEPVKLIRVPLLGHIAAGQPLLAQEHIVSWEVFPNCGYGEDEVFSLIVQGDSMTGARIYEGDRVLVRIQPEVEDGEIAVVNVDGENATLKRVKRLNGQVLLISDNPAYDPIVIESEQARICGKVVQVVFDPNTKK